MESEFKMIYPIIERPNWRTLNTRKDKLTEEELMLHLIRALKQLESYEKPTTGSSLSNYYEKDYRQNQHLKNPLEIELDRLNKNEIKFDPYRILNKEEMQQFAEMVAVDKSSPIDPTDRV